MSHPSARRLIEVGGVLFVAVALVAFLAFTRSGFPDSNDSAAKIASYFTAHRGAALAQDALIGVSGLAAVVFIAGIVVEMWRTEAARPLAVVAAIGGAAAVGAFVVGAGLLTTLSYRVPVGDPQLSRTLLNAGYITLNASGFVLAASIGAVAWASLTMGVFARWTGMVGAAAAALQVVGAVAYARGDGAMSPQGWVTLVALGSTLVWTLCIVADVMRHAEAVHPAPTAAAPA